MNCGVLSGLAGDGVTISWVVEPCCGSEYFDKRQSRYSAKSNSQS